MIPRLGRSPGEEKGYPLQYFGLKNSMDYNPQGCKESDMTEPLHFRGMGKEPLVLYLECFFHYFMFLPRHSTLQTNSCSYESESHSVVSDSLQPHGLYSQWNSPGRNTGVGSLSLLQGIFPTLGLNPGLPHCRWLLYQLSHKGSQDVPMC